MIKVRFHLAKGINFQKWQVADNIQINYHDPDNCFLVLENCTLKNYRKAANKIFQGQNKTVCAWVECESIEILEELDLKFGYLSKINYNPRIAPFWRDNKEKDIDGNFYDRLVTCKKNLYIF